MKFIPLIQALAALSWASAPALADPAKTVPSDKVRPPADPNQKICQDITVVGSRLATKRICATRAEWAAKRKDDKDMVDEIQRNPCILDTNGQCGSH
jgi:hypothetical protein